MEATFNNAARDSLLGAAKVGVRNITIIIIIITQPIQCKLPAAKELFDDISVTALEHRSKQDTGMKSGQSARILQQYRCLKYWLPWHNTTRKAFDIAGRKSPALCWFKTIHLISLPLPAKTAACSATNTRA